MRKHGFHSKRLISLTFRHPRTGQKCKASLPPLTYEVEVVRSIEDRKRAAVDRDYANAYVAAHRCRA